MKETTKLFNRNDVFEREYKKIKVSNSIIANIEQCAISDYVIWLLFAFFSRIQEGESSRKI